MTPDLRAHLDWALRQLRVLVTDDEGSGAFIRGTGNELAGYGFKFNQAKTALEAALASRGDTPQLHCRECPELMNELRGERDLAYQQALMESQRADALEIQLNDPRCATWRRLVVKLRDARDSSDAALEALEQEMRAVDASVYSSVGTSRVKRWADTLQAIRQGRTK